MRDVPQLKRVREDQGWSQRTLAARSGVAQNTISQLERGERKAMPSTVRKLADALGVDPPVLMAESRIDASIPREQQAVGRSAAASRQREAPSDQESQPPRQPGHFLDLLMERDKEKARAREEWYETGKWAEYYVSGEVGRRARAFDEAHDVATILSNFPSLKGSPVTFHSNPEKESEREYLEDIRTALHSYPGDLAAVRSRLISNDPKEILQAAQVVSERAKRIVDEHDRYLLSFRRIPNRYYADPAAHSRILKLREALADQRTEAARAVQELRDIYSEALDLLEDQIIGMRKESDVLEEFVLQTHNWEG